MDLNFKALHEISRLQEDILQALRTELKKLQLPDVRGASIASIPAQENEQNSAEQSHIYTPEVSETYILQPKRVYSPIINSIFTPRRKARWERNTAIETAKAKESQVKNATIPTVKYNYKLRNYPRPWADPPRKKKTISDQSMEVHLTSSHFSGVSSVSLTFENMQPDEPVACPSNQTIKKNGSSVHMNMLNRVSRQPSVLSSKDWPRMSDSGLLRVQRWSSQPPVQTADKVIPKDTTKMDLNLNYLDEETTNACFRHSQNPVDKASTYTLSRRRLKLESLLGLCGFPEDLLKGVEGPKQVEVLNVDNISHQPAFLLANKAEEAKKRNTKDSQMKFEFISQQGYRRKSFKKESDNTCKVSSSRRSVASKSKAILPRNPSRMTSNDYRVPRPPKSHHNKDASYRLKSQYSSRFSQTLNSNLSKNRIVSNSTSPFPTVEANLFSCATSLSGIVIPQAVDRATSPILHHARVEGAGLEPATKKSDNKLISEISDRNENIDPEPARSNNSSNFEFQEDTPLRFPSHAAIVVDCRSRSHYTESIPSLPETSPNIKRESLSDDDKQAITGSKILNCLSPPSLNIKACSSDFNLHEMTARDQVVNPVPQKQTTGNQPRARSRICPVRRVFQKRIPKIGSNKKSIFPRV